MSAKDRARSDPARLEAAEPPNPLMSLAGAWAEDGARIAAAIHAARRNSRRLDERGRGLIEE